jgi:hypothetical protein
MVARIWNVSEEALREFFEAAEPTESQESEDV